jgi:acyl-CoA synthetase (AMP-forming)/AMP-acid ligase II
MATAQTLPGVLRTAAAQYGERAAIVDGATTLSFTDLLDAVRETARAYVALGLETGDKVAIWAPNSWRWEVAALAVTYAGGTLVPINTRYTGHEAVDVIDRAAARMVVLADGFLGRAQTDELLSAADDGLAGVRAIVRITYEDAALCADPRSHDWDALPTLARGVDAAEVEARADAVSPDALADILFTSGTTGRSKGACTAHRQTVDVARIWGEIGGVNADDRYLIVNPFFHSFGYKVGLVTCLITGATVIPMAVFETTGMLELIEKHAVTVLPGAPAIYQALLEAPNRGDFDLSTLRLAVTGAAVVPVVLVERMQTELSFDTVFTAFGMTECVVGTMCRPGDSDELIANTCGRAVPGLELRIAKPGTNESLPVGEEGEVLFRGDHVMVGYLDDPEATAEAIDSDGWLHSGDVGRIDALGNLKITDRLKDVYFVGGFNVYPAEVEQTLARLDGVVESAVIGVPDERLGEVGKAFVVRRPGSSVTADDVIAFAKERLANFKVPRSVEFIDVLPRNPSGKVLKRELRND